MDPLTFVAALVEALAWPLTVVAGIALLRRPLAELLPQMRKLKYKDLEAEFGAEVREVEARWREVSPRGTARQLAPTSTAERLLGLSPNAAVLQAWRDVEAAAKRLIAARGLELDADVGAPYKLIESVLTGSGAVERRRLKVFTDLRRLRNKVAHAEDYELSPEHAEEYVRLAAELARHLDALADGADPAGADRKSS